MQPHTLRIITRLMLLALAAGAGTARAQPAAPESPPPVSGQAIQTPTGKNGYEALVAAADQLRASQRFAASERGDATLEAKHRALGDPPVVRALNLLRRGLAKPIFSPRETFVATETFAEMARFRSLARLLAMQQYVQLADGGVTEAISSARLGLRLGRAVQTDSLVAGLVGLAISSLSVGSLGAHLDPLSARDCELLSQLCREWLHEPDPFPRLVSAEQAIARRSLPEPLAKSAEVRRALDALYARAVAEWQKPAWQRAGGTPPGEEDPGGAMATQTLDLLNRAATLYTREQAQIRLLACHAAIRRYRWEHNRLPASLAALNLGELAIDPFTGQPLKYELQGTRYRLTSVGPEAAGGDPQAVNGRRPVSVGPRD